MAFYIKKAVDYSPMEVAIGISAGLISGYAGGIFDKVWSLVIDSVYSFPGLILAIAVAAMPGSGVMSITISVAVIYIPTYFRPIRTPNRFFLRRLHRRRDREHDINLIPEIDYKRIAEMFSEKTYTERRRRLKETIASGLVFFPGNHETPVNYPANTYPFRQDSSFLYFWGLDAPGLAAVIDLDEDRETVFGPVPSPDDIVWTGPRPTLEDLCLRAGVRQSAPMEDLAGTISEARRKNRTVHFLPQYRPENILAMGPLLGIAVQSVNGHASEPLIRAVVAQRGIKSEAEIAQIESALDITREMHLLAMKRSRPGLREREVAGEMAGLAYARGAALAFPSIFTTRGHIFHNLDQENIMGKGDLLVNDSGAESPLHYAGDITRTFPVGGRFSRKQKDIYGIVLNAQQSAIEAIGPGIEYREVHRIAAKSLAIGLALLGVMKGDPDEAVAAGAHALFFPHGIGHMLGLDVHDMEGLGEDFVGYTREIRRSTQFGTRHLRLARALEPGFVVTVEPGLYFIPHLIARWKAERRHEEFIDYRRVDDYLDLGGIRIEDDVLVLEDGCRILGEPIPKTIADVEAASSEHP
jgi:Xaa-Pro aminopeptidase